MDDADSLKVGEDGRGGRGSAALEPACRVVVGVRREDGSVVPSLRASVACSV